MRRAEVCVDADLMRMHRAQVPITRLTRLRLEIALEAARCVAAVDRAAVSTLTTARADDSGDAAGKAKRGAGHQVPPS